MMNYFPLHQAIRENDKEKVCTLITEGINVNKMDNEGKTALHLAVELETAETVKFLLSSGAKSSINAEDCDGLSPLWLAVKFSKKEALSMLLEDDEPDMANSEGEYLVHFTANYCNPEILKLLVEYSAIRDSINCPDKQGQTCLSLLLDKYKYNELCTSEDGFFKSVEILLDAGGDPNSNETGHSLLHRAVDVNSEKLVEILINADADVNILNLKGHTPLTKAIKDRKSKRIIEMLVEAGADVNHISNHGTALKLAAEKIDLKLLKYLISQGANFNGMEITPDTMHLYLMLEQLIKINVDEERVENVEGSQSFDK